MRPAIPKRYIAPREGELIQVYVRTFQQTPYHETWLRGQQFEEITVTPEALEELLEKAKDREQETANRLQREAAARYGPSR